MKVVSFIPVREGSKSIPLKNIKKIAGKPLVFWSIDAALESTIVNEVYISTDSHSISEKIYQYYGKKIKIIERSKESATDTAPSEIALLEFCNEFEFDFVFFQQATSPLIEGIFLDEAFEKLKRQKADSLLSVVRQKRFIWSEREEGGFISPYNYNFLKRPRRQDFKGFLVENGAFYLSSRHDIIESGCRISKNITYYEMPENTYFEIDEPSDWIIIEGLLMKKKVRNNFSEKKKLKIDTLILDVDGTLTDGGMYYSPQGEFMKKFNTRDAFGIRLLMDKGIEVIIITSENSKIVEERLKKMKITEFYLGVNDKFSLLEKIKLKKKIEWDAIGYVGDDLNDLEAMKSVGFKACPSDAEKEILEISDFISPKRAGYGAIREIVNYILNVNNFGRNISKKMVKKKKD